MYQKMVKIPTTVIQAAITIHTINKILFFLKAPIMRMISSMIPMAATEMRKNLKIPFPISSQSWLGPEPLLVALMAMPVRMMLPIEMTSLMAAKIFAPTTLLTQINHGVTSPPMMTKEFVLRTLRFCFKCRRTGNKMLIKARIITLLRSHLQSAMSSQNE